MTETPISRTIRRLFAGGGAIGLVILALPAPAQEAAPKPVPRVEITGSNIRRSEAETASSVITVNRADIERSGKATVAELLQTLAVDNQGSVPTTFGNGFAAGASGISLRGLGAASTLVLMNGRRMAPYGLADDGQKQFTDLNVIPTDAVERVEILKDGASAIYGSDAIAGVVNIILRRDFQGNTVRFQRGASDDWDGKRMNVAFTKGVGSLDTDRYNVLFSIEYKKFDEIWYRDRADREWIGRNDLRRWGYSAEQALGGTGAILPGTGTAGNAINGNVRNPADPTNYYNRGNLAGPGFTRTFPGAACSNFTNHPQGDPGGGCLIDASLMYNQIEPKQENLSFFLRGTMQLNPALQLYSELNWYTSQTDTATTPSSVSASVGFPGGPVNNAVVQLGPTHPDNPYFGTAARFRYLAADVGPRKSNIDSNFLRWLGGAKGTNYGWDWDSALLFSHNHVNNTQNGFLQRDVAFALLDPSAANVAAATANSAAYRALPPGTFWRIAENAPLNSPALYAALSPTILNTANTKVGQIDFKATREFSGIPYLAGNLGLALGTEFRHEMTELLPTTGTERGNVIGLGYSAYSGARNVFALYGEGLAPLPFNVEASAALRYDHFTDVGSSYTPKFGLKWTPVREFALRGTFARGFRAPSPAENGVGGLAAFSTAADPVRCALGVTSACNPASVALVTSPNPNLSPERSRSYTLGVIWDPLPRTSISVDYWKIKRKNEINQEQVDAAIAAGHVARDPGSVSGIPGDPGQITAVLTRYVNSAQSKVRGLDVDARYNHRLPDAWGNATFDVKYTHIFEWLRTEQDGTSREFAGTHGNCDVTNCTGTPADRVNMRFGWDRNNLRVSANVNYRGVLENRFFRGDPSGCAVTFANGTDAPNGCELASFTTVDLVVRWKPQQRWEVFGSIQNLFDKIAPLDPLTYGAQAYNPLDYEGARGRFFTLGARYSF
ncbi:iron complex outermembrane recepter protein [Massilia sp. PDC64]|nr:TonB-dependent receptor [Massilia sp. PDC64]SDF07795.1 iron complex outermembrane recepter protein [Massilia sp. PDC64]